MSYRAASALKSGVVYSGSAIVNGVNAITPHLAGAVDILVVRQPDGSLKSSPFYVRFGKYTSYRTRDRSVKILINGEETRIHMHLGSYGQAYFVAEYSEVNSGSEEEAALSGMISPPSGYSSGELNTPYANADLVESVRTEIDLLRKEAKGNMRKPSETQPDSVGGGSRRSGFNSSNDSNSGAEETRTEQGPRLANERVGNAQTLDFEPMQSGFVLHEDAAVDQNTQSPDGSVERSAESPFSPPEQQHHAEFLDGGGQEVSMGDTDAFDDEVEGIRIASRLRKGECSAQDLVAAADDVLDACLSTVEEGKLASMGLRRSDSIDFPSLEARDSAVAEFGLSDRAIVDHEHVSVSKTQVVIDEQIQFSGLGGESLEGTHSECVQVHVARSTSSQTECEKTHQVPRTRSAPIDVERGGIEDGEGEQSEKQVLAVKLPVEEDPANEGYLGDSDQPATGFASPTSAVDHRLEGLDGLREFQLSLCGHLLRRDMLPGEAQAVFQENMIDKDQFAHCGLSLCNSPDLVCRIGGTLYPWNAAAPMVLGMLAFGGNWDSLIRDGSSYPIEIGHSNKGSPLTRKVSSGWRLWPFGSWKGRPVNKSGDLSPIDTEIPPSPENSSDVRFSNTPEPSDPFMPRASSKIRYNSSRKKHRVVTKKTLNPTSEQLASLKLKHGRNVIEFQIGSNTRIQAYIYIIDWKSRLVISDIDGTVTRSDLLGHLLPPIGVDWTHSGVAHLFSDITSNGYEIMFLSSRAIAQANVTRDFLHSLEQGEHKMPLGPVIISPHGLLPSLYREMILRRPHDFKIGCLQDIRILFPDDWNPFYAGFGNRGTDVLSYEKAGVPPSRIFTINSKGQIIRGSLSSTQTSTWSSLQSINELVDKVFPPLNTGEGPPLREEFNDFRHWKLCMSVGFDDPELGDLHQMKTEDDTEVHNPGHLAQSVLSS